MKCASLVAVECWFSFKPLRNLSVLCGSCGFRLNLLHRRDAEDSEGAQKLQVEPTPALMDLNLLK